jgi:UDP-N-acetylmuramoyl-L-alanyl-D-glutamate--2,6-diaminopimelate ligase
VPQKRVSALAAHINAAQLVAGGGQTITGITNDSRRVVAGSLYAALAGEHVDGHEYIDAAVQSGARGVLCSRLPSPLPEGIAVFESAQPRLALSEIANAFYDMPSDALQVIGVTGTDGKTSTVYFIHQLLEACGMRSAFLSTAAMKIGDSEQANRLHQSTPEAPVIHASLREMVAEGNRFAVLESTSHGLSAKTCRLAHVAYRAAVLTNVTHEHLEFHGTYERYRDDKANLFRALDSGRFGETASFHAAVDEVSTADSTITADVVPGRTPGPPPVRSWDESARAVGSSDGRFGIVNLDAPDAWYFANATKQPVFGYGIGATSGTIRATDIQADSTGSRFTLRCGDVSAPARLNVPGVFNIENALAAVLTVALLTDRHPTAFVPEIVNLRPVHGRMNVVCSSPFAVVVDYAHTPGSFRRVLPYFREHTSGRLIAVFGSAGERDIEKRPLQGEIANEFADIIILADEDPRGEPRMEILNQIASGCPDRREGTDLHKIPDRREAISTALTMAQPGDTVLLLGKGHESSIIGRDGPSPWDEESVAREELARLEIGLQGS